MYRPGSAWAIRCSQRGFHLPRNNRQRSEAEQHNQRLTEGTWKLTNQLNRGEIDQSDRSGQPVVAIDVVMTNQRGEEMAAGRAEARLPTESLPAE